ncbi:MAG: glycosyltransferase family 4 protein [Pseudonocardia sp.]|nr:glycosyltransferase family 4 protein [Pseudonocardia sp.]
MKIVFDCRYIRIGRHDGISRYTAGLVTALAKRHPVTMLVHDARQLEKLPPCPYELVSAPTSIREPLVARQVRRLCPDVVFTPMQTMGGWGRTYPLVLTVHDLIYYRHPTPPPEFAPPIRVLWRLYHRGWWPQRILLNRADAVVAVSHTTAALIAEHRLTRRPVTVVPNAADPVPDPARLPRGGALVYMGSFMPYKNVATLAAAMARLPDHVLHLMSRVTNAQRAPLVAAAGAGRLVFHDGASDEGYHEVLRGATALVSASREEGFGIPLVEAMAVGTPLVVSDIPVFREVGGDSGAAAFVDPDDVAGFAAAVRSLEDRWDAASAAAGERAAHYTWERSADTLLELLGHLAR